MSYNPRRAVARATALLATITVAAASANANAQNDLADDKRRQAEDRFTKGLELIGQGALDAALAEFQASRALFPTRAATRNGAIVLRRLGRFDEALDAWEAFVREFPTRPPSESEQADHEILELRRLVGFVVVDGEQGARVFLDGRDLGTLPLPPTRTSSGHRTISVHKEGYLPFKREVDLAGQVTVRIAASLVPVAKGARLRVESVGGTTASVVVDGATLGATPWVGLVSEGRHVVQLRGDRPLASAPVVVTVEAGRPALVNLQMERQECRLRIVATPPATQIAVDGTEVALGQWEGDVRCGGHAVELRADGFLPYVTGTVVARGKSAVIEERLERDPSSPLWQRANPPRITFELRAAGTLGEAFASPLDCASPCTESAGVGAWLNAAFGYRLGVGLGFAAEVGFVHYGKTITGRATTLYPVGLPGEPGTATDTLRLNGISLGGALAFDRGTTYVIGARLGAGMVLAGSRDTRTGEFGAGSPAGPFTTDPKTVVQGKSLGSLRAVYVAPEVRLGYRVHPHWMAYIGVQALLSVFLGDTNWAAGSEVLAGSGCREPGGRCLGQATYGAQAIFGGTSVALGPTLGVRGEY